MYHLMYFVSSESKTNGAIKAENWMQTASASTNFKLKLVHQCPFPEVRNILPRPANNKTCYTHLFWNKSKTCVSGFLGDWVVKVHRDSTWLLEAPRYLLSAMDNIVYYFLPCNLNIFPLKETSLSEMIFYCSKIFQISLKPLLCKSWVYDSRFIILLVSQIFIKRIYIILNELSTHHRNKTQKPKIYPLSKTPSFFNFILPSSTF